MKEVDTIFILNLVGELEESLINFLTQESIVLIPRGECENYNDLSYILVDSEEEAQNAFHDYSADKYDIEIISIGNIYDYKTFLKNNGKLVVNETIANQDLGREILRKFLMNGHSIHLDESYPEVANNIKNIKVTSHLSLGYYSDEVVLEAFDNGFNIVSLRSFIDHIVYYFSYLKQAGLAGSSFELEYSTSDDYFVVSIHLSVKNFVADFLLDSFGDINSDDPIQYLLTIIKNSSDFLELVFIEKTSKLVFRGFWNKISKQALKGVSLNNILTSAQINKNIERELEDYVENAKHEKNKEELIKDISDRSLPGGLNEFLQVASDSAFADDPIKALEVVEQIEEKFIEKNPDKNIEEITTDEVVELVRNFNGELADKLTEEDREKLAKQVQKINSTKAISEEVERVKEELQDSDEFKTSLLEKVSQEIANNVSANFDDSFLDQLIKNVDEEEVVNKVNNITENNDDEIKVKSVDDQDSDDIVSFSGNEEDNDIANKVSGGKAENEEAINVAGTTAEKELNSRVSGGKERDEGAINVSGGKGSDETHSRVSGSKEAEDQNSLVKGSKEAKDKFQMAITNARDTENSNMISKISSNLNDHFKTGNFKIGGSNTPDVKKMISSSLINAGGSNGVDPNLRNFLEDKIPDNYAKKLKEYAQSIGKDLGELDESDIESFNTNQVPELIQNILNDQEEIENYKNVILGSFENNNDDDDLSLRIKSKVKDKLKDLSLKSNGVIENPKDVIKSVIKEEIAKEFNDKDDFKEKEQKIVESLSEFFKVKGGEGSKDIQEIVSKSLGVTSKETNNAVLNKLKQVSEESEKKLMLQSQNNEENASGSNVANVINQNNTYEKNALVKKLKKASLDNKGLNEKIKALEIQLKTLKETDQKMNQIKDEVDKKVKEKIQKVQSDLKDPEILPKDIKENLMIKLESGNISSEEKMMLQKSLKKESELIEGAKEATLVLRKMKIELDQKDNQYKTEVNKMQKILKAKDTVVNKAKDSMKMLVRKTADEKKVLNDKIVTLNKRLNEDKSQHLRLEIKNLKKDNESLRSSKDQYVSKLNQLTKKMKQTSDSKGTQSVAENPKEIEKLQSKIKNLTNNSEKEKQRIQKHLEQSKKSEMKMKTQMNVLIPKLKELEGQLQGLSLEKKKLQEELKSAGQANNSKTESSSNVSQEEISTLKSKLKEMKAKLTKAEEEVAKNSKSGNLPKEKKLEKDVKKLQMDLTKAKQEAADKHKDVMKMKGENTALKNKIKNLEKQLSGKKKSA